MPGVIYQNRDRPEFLARSVHDPPAIRLFADVCHGKCHLSALLHNFRRRRGKFIAGTRCQENRSAFLCEKFRDRSPDSAPSSGNQCVLSLQCHRPRE